MISPTRSLFAWALRDDKQLAAAKTPHEQTVLNAQLAAADRHIDRLVYELYGLSADEIKIVEEGTGN